MKLTRSQQLIYNTEKYSGGSVGVICGSMLIPGVLDVAQLKQAVNCLRRANDILRVRIREAQNGISQEILDFSETDPKVLCFESEEELNAYGNEWAHVPMDFHEELCEIQAVILPSSCGLIAKLHHIISDAWSLALLGSQFLEVLDGKEIQAGSYLDYVKREEEYLESRRCEKDRTYFLDNYKKCDEPVLLRSRRENLYEAERSSFLIGQEKTARIMEYIRQKESSVFPLFTAALAVYISRTSDNVQKFYIGTTVLNRTGNEEKNTVGMFINTIPMLIELDDQKSFAKNLASVESSVMAALRHGRYNYGDILQDIRKVYDTDLKLYDVLLNYQNASVEGDSFKTTWYPCGRQIETLQIHIEDRDKDGVFHIHYDYLKGCYSAEDIKCMHEHLCNILFDAVSHEEKKTSELRLLSCEEEKTVVHSFNDTAASFPEDETVYSLFEKTVSKHPDEVCITHDGGSLTFRQFQLMAEKVDAFLRGKLPEKGAVGVIADRSIEELAAIYGIIRGGNAYVPISPDYPKERIHSMLKSSACQLVLTHKAYRNKTDSTAAIEDILAAEYENIPVPALKSEDILYTIFTSGSTGEPKGAMNSCRAFVNRVNWMNRIYPLDNGGVILLKTPYTFDVSTWEIFWWAMFDGRLHILPPKDHYEQGAVLRHIEMGKVTHIHFVPSVFRAFISWLEQTPDEKGKLKSLRHIILSGEALEASDVNRFHVFNTDGRIKVHNLYGPAECAVDVTYYDCRDVEEDPIPIGKPIENVRIYVLDRYMNPLPIGIPGELYIGGTGVGRGYAGREELTKERFIPNPFSSGMLYKTGDRGYWRPDGRIVYCGRNDAQVKLFGQRIELGEIEKKMMAIDGIIESVVILKHSPDQLIGFYIGRDFAEKELKNLLNVNLPKYMVPARFMRLDAFPLNASGKTDRRAMAKIELPDSQVLQEEYEPAQNELEEKLCRLFAKELETDPKLIGRSTNLIDVGGTSLNLVSLLSNPILQGLKMEDLMRDPTPAGIAELLNNKENRNFAELTSLYVPQFYKKVCILFPFSGGDSASYMALTSEFKRLGLEIALYFVSWRADLKKAAEEIRKLAENYEIGFYSHCLGAVLAMKLINKLNTENQVVRFFFAGANIPHGWGINVKKFMAVYMSDSMILRTLENAGLNMGDASEEEVAQMVLMSRLNAVEYHSYFQKKRKPADIELTCILSKKDPFTPNYNDAEKNWHPFVSEYVSTVFLNSRSHYFQNTNAGQIADLLMEKFGELPHFAEQV